LNPFKNRLNLIFKMQKTICRTTEVCLIFLYNHQITMVQTIKMATTQIISEDIYSQIIRFKSLKIKLTENESVDPLKSKFLLCPICQEGKLLPVVRRKIFGFIPDFLLICNKCSAEFDKRLNKARLINAPNDPYGIFKQYKTQTLPQTKWQQIALQKTKKEIDSIQSELSDIKNNLEDYVLSLLKEGTIKIILCNIKGFFLKNDEKPLFSGPVSILEERKGRFTERTTVGGGRRNYSGFSFRVAKGLYYHAGSSEATPRQTIVQTTEYTELADVDLGELLITNQRILFKGGNRAFTIPINKIVAIDNDPVNNAFLIMREYKKPLILNFPANLQVKLDDIELEFPISLDYIVSLIKNPPE
jgi:hypothetical protein